MPRIALVLAALALSASVAQAQIPNLRRKAKEAGQRAATGQPSQQKAPPKFDNTMLELNPQVVARLINGLEARSTAKGAGGLTAGELRKRSTAASEEAVTLNNQHSDDRAKWTEANEAAERCMEDELGKAEQRHNEEMQRRFSGMNMNSPENAKFMQEYSAAAQEIQQASLANDTAAIRRATEKMAKVLGVDAHADSVKARAACHAPAVPAWMRRADSLAALGDTLVVRARDAEASANAAAARAAEMTPQQFAMAAERAEGFVLLKASGNVGSGYVFTPTEEQALTARLPDLKKYFG